MKKALVVLGAGATAGSGFKIQTNPGIFVSPPTEKEFWAFTKSIAAQHKIETKGLDFLLQELGLDRTQFGLEQIWNVISVHRKYAAQNYFSYSDSIRDSLHNRDWLRPWTEIRQHSVEHGAAKQAELDLVKVLTLVYGRLLLSGYKDQPKSSQAHSYKPLITLLRDEFDIRVMTFNYDCTLEWAMNIDMKIGYHYPNFNHFPQNNEAIPILKLHGSLNWKHGIDGHVRLKSLPTSSDDYIQHAVIDVGEIGQFGQWNTPKVIDCWAPMVIPPVLFKEELFFATGQEIVRSHFDNIWRMAVGMTQKAERIIFVGYSFPEADPHARWLFSLKDKNAPIFVIGLGETDRQKFFSVLGHNRISFCSCGFAKSANCLSEWLKKAEWNSCPSSKRPSRLE